VIETQELLLENQKLREENHTKDLRISKLESQIEQLLRTVYGSKSERYAPTLPGQISLELDIPVSEKPEVKKETITYERNKSGEKSNHKGRPPLPDHIQRVKIVVPQKEDVTGLIKVGEEITEQLECEPGKLYIKQFIREKYAKPDGEGIIIPELPSFIIPRGIAGAGLLALILIQKYIDHLPLYRQIDQFKRMGIDIPSSTMSDWVAMCIHELTPLYQALKSKIVSSNYLQADETPIKVLDRDKKGTTHRGFYWVYRDPQSGLVLFDYQKGRGREGPTEILKNFEGYLQSDGHHAYENFDKGKIKLIHCMAHARRYFEKALDENKLMAEHVLNEMQKLYSVERTARENKLSFEDRKELRRKESLPVLEELHKWMKTTIIQTTPQSLTGKALAYSLPRWEKLMLYTTDGKLEIDNNLVENSIRPIAIGRKNYLFAGSHESAQRAAMIYSLLGTGKLKGVEPFQWLKNVFEVLPDWKFNRLEELLP
jgi:transposase